MRMCLCRDTRIQPCINVCLYVCAYTYNKYFSFYTPPSLALSFLSGRRPFLSLLSPFKSLLCKRGKRQDKRSIDDPRPQQPQRSGEIFAELNWISQQLHYHRLYGRIRENEIKIRRVDGGEEAVWRGGDGGRGEKNQETSKSLSCYE